MDKRLSEAAFHGDLLQLHQIAQEDPLILHRIAASCFHDTPLHTAAALGHLSFVKELLTRNPELAVELDSRGCSPLHLAAAKGHADVVKELLLVNTQVSSLRNSDGRTVLHVAAIKGRESVLAELLGLAPGLTRSLTDRRETGLHLSVKWNRCESVKLLCEDMRRDGDDDSSMNWKDCDGNTSLHIAVAQKHFEIIKYLLQLKEVEVNALNKNRLTPLDLLLQSPRDTRDLEIEHLLLNSCASSSMNLHSFTDKRVRPQTTRRLSSQQSQPQKPVEVRKPTDWLGRRRSALMVVASLIATVAFQAGLTPPGGVWQDDYTVDDNGQPVSNPHTAGQAVMAYQEPKVYGVFMIFNTIAFLASLSIILLLVSGLPLRQRRWTWLQMVIMWVAISAQVATYFVTLRHMSPDDVEGTLHEVTEISVLTWLTLIAVVFIGNVIRLNMWVLRKYGCIKGKESDAEAVDDDGDDEFE